MLKDRLLTAAAIAVVLLAVLYLLPPVASKGLITAVILLGAWEWSNMLPATVPWRRLLPLLLAALLAYWWLEPPTAVQARAVLSIAAVWWVLALVWIVGAPQLCGAWLTTIAGGMSLAPLWIAVIELRGADKRGASVLLFGLLVVVAADTGAYFAGRAFGRIKLAPRVSPGKTWEGVFGGLLLSALVVAVSAPLLGWPLRELYPLALAVAAVSVVGDLLESTIKRQAGVKDSGTWFPGHGGILDRIDSLTAGLPILALGLAMLGWLS